MKSRIFVSIMLLVAILGQTSQVLADTTTVPCKTSQLISAIAAANATRTDDIINLKARCTYTLVSVHNSTLGATGLPAIADTAIAGKLTINGNGATIERSKGRRTLQFRIFSIAIGGDLTLDNVTIRNGNLPIEYNGGGISNDGSLTVSNSTITGNSADYGGGIVSYYGSLTVINSRFNGNKSVHDGAGINSSGLLKVTSSTFSSNVSGGQSNSPMGSGLGGGILVAEGIAIVTDSTFSANVAHGFAGGAGILHGGCECGPSELTVVGSTFTNNYADGAGGGLFNTEGSIMTVTNSTISGNQGASGGGISNDGSLTVSNSTITGNSAEFGGGIVSGGTLTVTNSHFNGNTSIRDGGGINSSGTLNVTRSTFSSNVSGQEGNSANGGLGGGILIAEGNANVTESTFSGNVAHGLAGGGGILNGGFGPSELIVVGSTFTNNIGNGGALFNTDVGTMTVTNSTISGNQSMYRVGGIFNAGTLTVTHSTITDNISQHEGGGIFNDGGEIYLGSTIVAGNTALSGPDIFGLIISLGYNLIGNTSSTTIIGDTTGNLIDEAAVPLNLGPLQNNGGPTQTRALQAGSVAINAGDPDFAQPPAYDQRGAGFPRVVGTINIGAYESNP